ncbi:chemotaxis protein CheW [Endozoicomonas atrinae]|uniref:chemotaxis protein CheW n=1 Tax=Endozoicomonas atrinae TaxID=1333660 RepID=UPI00082600E9|nr:chemotaxis protein CheW [Endozoicomonas atrinae]
MIYLRFEIAGQSYALTSDAIVEVIPFLPIKKITHISPEVSGMLDYRGNLIPVIDLSMLFHQQTSSAYASTRIVVVNYLQEDKKLLLALIAERATETIRLDESDFTPQVISNKRIPYSATATVEEELIYRLEVEGILPSELKSQLYPQNTDSGEPGRHVN